MPTATNRWGRGVLTFSERHGPMGWASAVVPIGALAFVCTDTVKNAREAL